MRLKWVAREHHEHPQSGEERAPEAGNGWEKEMGAGAPKTVLSYFIIFPESKSNITHHPYYFCFNM